MAEQYFMLPDGTATADASLAQSLGGRPFNPEGMVSSTATDMPQQQQAPPPRGEMSPQMRGEVPESMTMSEMMNQGPPDTTGMHPVVAQSIRRKWLNAHGKDIEHYGGRAEVQEGWVPVQRTGAVPDIHAGDRENLADRERALVRDERDIQYQENDMAQLHLMEEQQRKAQQVQDQELRTGSINESVRKEQIDLDNQMTRHREMISKGLDPWRAFGDGSTSGKIAAALGLMTTTMAGGQESQEGQQLFNRIIDREIDKQKYELNTQGDQVDNAYARLRAELGDRDQAEAALRAMMLDASKAKLMANMSQTADVRSQQAANEAILAIDKQELEAKEAYYARSLGKMTERWQEHQAGYSGGTRLVDFERPEWDAYLKNTAGLAKTAAETKKTWNESNGLEGSGDPLEAALMSIPQADRKRIREMDEQARMIDNMAKLMGADGYNPETGEILGEVDPDVPGMGPLDKPMSSMPWASDRAVQVNGALSDLTYSLVRPDVGANFTGIEAEKVKAFTEAYFEGNQKAKLQYIAKRMSDKYKAALSPLGERQVSAVLRRHHQDRTPDPSQFGARKR